MTEWYYNFRETLEENRQKAKAFKMLVALLSVLVVGLLILTGLFPQVMFIVWMFLLGTGVFVGMIAGITWSIMTLNE